MRLANAITMMVGAAFSGCLLWGQQLQITGTAMESAGTVLKLVTVTVKDDKGNVIDQTVTNGEGHFVSKGGRGKLLLECQASSDGYSPNPVRYPNVVIPAGSNLLKHDCTFDQYTLVFSAQAAADYWLKVARNVGAKQEKDDQAFDKEWTRLKLADVPPESKAAAAHQFIRIKGGDSITDSMFKEYSKADPNDVSKAVKGDSTALKNLPELVMSDVQAYKNTNGK